MEALVGAWKAVLGSPVQRFLRRYASMTLRLKETVCVALPDVYRIHDGIAHDTAFPTMDTVPAVAAGPIVSISGAAANVDKEQCMPA
ncbi:hypothetical protein DL770_005321 [Monosporascus sp. CRB-9-2]|nr:hypothetical protein DL770_005321 [Monosporascus sp. CRB-9-2]